MWKFTMTTSFTSRQLATSYEILVTTTEFLVALATRKAQFRTLERVEGPIDYPITDEEFEAAVNKLKGNKSPGIDNILKEVIRIGKEVITGHLVNLFNPILDTGKYPALWSFGFIVRSHNKNDRSKVKNYRGITLLSALGKIFT